MGRYTTVQTYSDTNPMVVKLPYDEAAAKSSAGQDDSSDARGPRHGAGYTVERVNNVMGSTAGAGSGDFHHYRHTRRREMMRMENMEKDATEDQAEEDFAARVEAKRKECQERTRRNAEKRKRKRQKRSFAESTAKNSKGEKSTPIHAAPDSPVDESAFSYTPLHVSDPSAPSTAPLSKTVAVALVANDGSFMQKVKEAMEKSEVSSGSKDKASDISDPSMNPSKST